MNDLSNFFRQQYAADTVSACAAMPTPTPTLITIDYDALGSYLEKHKECLMRNPRKITFDQMFDSNFEPKIDGLDHVAPLTSFVLKNMDIGGLDVQRLSYSVYAKTRWVLPGVPNEAHIDSGVGLNSFQTDIVEATKHTRTILSNICTTAVCPHDVMRQKRPYRMDEQLFFAGMLSCIRSKMGFLQDTASSDLFSNGLFRNAARKIYANKISYTVEQLKQKANEFVKPAPSNAITMTGVTVHALTCRPASPRDGTLRHVIMFDCYSK